MLGLLGRIYGGRRNLRGPPKPAALAACGYPLDANPDTPDSVSKRSCRTHTSGVHPELQDPA
ncbi:hypothetical protein MyNCGM121_60600 [Achromobacter xylosoxidans]